MQVRFVPCAPNRTTSHCHFMRLAGVLFLLAASIPGATAAYAIFEVPTGSAFVDHSGPPETKVLTQTFQGSTVLFVETPAAQPIAVRYASAGTNYVKWVATANDPQAAATATNAALSTLTVQVQTLQTRLTSLEAAILSQGENVAALDINATLAATAALQTDLDALTATVEGMEPATILDLQETSDTIQDTIAANAPPAVDLTPLQQETAVAGDAANAAADHAETAAHAAKTARLFGGIAVGFTAALGAMTWWFHQHPRPPTQGAATPEIATVAKNPDTDAALEAYRKSREATARPVPTTAPALVLTKPLNGHVHTAAESPSKEQVQA